MTITIHYHDEDVEGIVEETLALYRYKSLLGWYKVGEGPPPGEGQTLNEDDNVLQAWLRGLSRFGTYGARAAGSKIFLPVVLRNYP